MLTEKELQGIVEKVSKSAKYKIMPDNYWDVKMAANLGAGSVVTRDIPPYSVAVGSPAKVIKKRT